MKNKIIEHTDEYVILCDSKGIEFKITTLDLPIISNYTWITHRNRSGHIYVETNHTIGSKRTILKLHRLILDVNVKDIYVDHINNDGLDNTRKNLRKCSHQQNQWNRQISSDNTSGIKGVRWHKQSNKWQASIQISGKYKSKYFTDKQSAINWIDVIREDLHGKFKKTK